MTVQYWKTVAVAALLLATGVDAQRGDSTEALLRAAIDREIVDGDIAGAIEMYQSIAARFSATDRAVAAQALLRAGFAYEKSRDSRAHATFRRIVAEFADQLDVVAAARERLAASPQDVGHSGMASRQLWASTNGDVDFWRGGLSPDGRYVSFVDWSNGDLVLRDLRAGTDRRLTDNPPPGQTWVGFADNSAISRDGRSIAYAWRQIDAAGRHWSVRVLELDPPGSAARTVLEDAGVDHLIVHDWSPDGRWLAVQLSQPDGSNQLGLLSVPAGELRVLRSVDWRGSTDLKFSPDGRLLAYDLPAGNHARDVWAIAVDGSRNSAVTQHDSDDVVIGWTAGGTLLFRSDRSGSAGLWSQRVADGRPEGSAELVRGQLEIEGSFGVMPSGGLSYITATGGPVVSIAVIDPDSGRTVSPPARVTDLEPLPRQGDWSPDGKSLVLRSRLRGREVLSILNMDTGERRSWNLPFTWIRQVKWLTPSTILVRAQDLKARWGLHRVDPASGQTHPVEVGTCRSELCPATGDLLALIHSVSPDLTSVFYALQQRPGDGGERVVIQRDLRAGGERERLRGSNLFGFRLSPDGRQMTFIQRNAEPDIDVLSVLSIVDGRRREVFRTTGSTRLTNLLEWAPDGRRLLFGQSDGSQEVASLIPAAGGVAVALELRVRQGADDPYRSVQLHPDGRRLLLTSGAPETAEIWVLENFLPDEAARR
jgi:Tol biopolymer transport system component